MFNHPYVMEKLMELEKPRATRNPRYHLPARTRRANGVARAIGRAMRRAGEGLEAWAGPAGSDYSCPDTRYY
jgi:hypothetical protein